MREAKNIKRNVTNRAAATEQHIKNRCANGVRSCYDRSNGFLFYFRENSVFRSDGIT